MLGTLAVSLTFVGVAVAAPFIPNLQGYSNTSGTLRTYSTLGDLDQANDFFQSLGTNGRRCSTCHMLSQGLGLSAAMARQIFETSNGLHPLFRPHDAANSPEMDVSTY